MAALARVTGYVTDIFTERALSFIGQNRASPFLLMLSHKALHPNIRQQADGTVVPIGEGGLIPAERHKKLYADAIPPRRGNYGAPPHGKPALERVIPSLTPLGLATVKSDETIRDRLRMLVAVDESLGRIMEALQKRGILDKTVIILMGDNGYFYNEKSSSDLLRRMESELDALRKASPKYRN